MSNYSNQVKIFAIPVIFQVRAITSCSVDIYKKYKKQIQKEKKLSKENSMNFYEKTE